ncbi:hypothetical protein [Pseudodesulfovibrio portus]|uniref:DUF945 domain-containing protein n=1 Tax=Pseudodesulfovibrio portus TaxID=231439 RepID=A0ABM8AT53_9BACT|nr:hypothetical protein [Pseudodesulfovibrio portus]BDQ34637.1 hypothetical protein JCM14722_21790 [Pseudodesulfovibrio portus]
MRPIWKFLISFVIFVAVCAAGVGWFIENEVEKGLNKAVAETKGLRLDYADCSVNILDHTVGLTDVRATLPSGHHFTAAKLLILAFDQLNPLPYYATATCSGLDIPVTYANFGSWAAPMQKMGISSVKGEASLDYTYSPDTATLTIKELSLHDDDLGRARLSGQIDQLDMVTPRLEQLIGVRIKAATLDFTNLSLMDHLIADWAKKMDSSTDVTVARIAAELGGLADYARAQDNAQAENVMLGLKRFVTDPGTMTVSATPEDPVPVLYFFMGRDLMENLRLLDMKIETDSDDQI